MDTTGVISVILSIVIIVTFFLMSSKLSRIAKATEGLYRLEADKPENKVKRSCIKCGKEFMVPKDDLGDYIVCPHCNKTQKADR